MSRLINADGTDVTNVTLEGIKKAYGAYDQAQQSFTKAATVTTASGFVAIDLETPAKNLYPILTPILNRIPRITRKNGGAGPQWKQVNSVQVGGVQGMMWLTEGMRAPNMVISTQPMNATYVTGGVETEVTFESESAAMGFEDVVQTAGMRLLQVVKQTEEISTLFGNRSLQLGTPSTPTVAVASTGGSIPTGSYNVAVVALTGEGYQSASVAGGVFQQVTVTGSDGKTVQLNCGSSNKSATATATIGASVTTGVIKAAVTPVRGALAYAWYAGAAGSETLQAITTTAVLLLTALSTGNQALTSITADRSSNPTVAYDGLITTALNSGSGYYYAMPNDTTNYKGTPLTPSGGGTVIEIDNMLQAFWDTKRISPDELYVSSVQLKQIRDAVVGNGGAPLVRFMLDVNNPDVVTLAAGQIVGYYTNIFTMNGGQIIPIRLHPFIPAGTIFAWCQDLPAYYMAANVPQVAQIMCRRDYYQIPWTPVSRSNQTGVYLESCLVVYFPAGLGVITNIGGN